VTGKDGTQGEIERSRDWLRVSREEEARRARERKHTVADGLLEERFLWLTAPVAREPETPAVLSHIERTVPTPRTRFARGPFSSPRCTPFPGRGKTGDRARACGCRAPDSSRSAGRFGSCQLDRFPAAAPPKFAACVLHKPEKAANRSDLPIPNSPENKQLGVEPTPGLEPGTYGLRNRCSTS
jgi:hypothetical protein